MPHESHALPVHFYSQHTISKSTVAVVLHRTGHYPALQSVLSCTDPDICEQLCLLLNTAASHPGVDIDDELDNIASQIPAPVLGSLRQAITWTVARSWPAPTHIHRPRPHSDDESQPWSATGTAEDEGSYRESWPDFAKLFPATTLHHTTDLSVVDDDSLDELDEEYDWALTARSAAIMWVALDDLAASAHADLDGHGGRAVHRDTDWVFFNRLPEISWRQPDVWRLRMIQTADDLLSDLAAGREPIPRNNAEELLLHLALADANDVGELHDIEAAFPSDVFADDSDDWRQLTEYLMQDIDVLLLYNEDVAGIEHPDNAANRYGDVGDLRPDHWFTWFNNVEPRNQDRHGTPNESNQ